MFLRNSKPRIWHSWYGTITLTNPDDEIKQEEVKSCVLNKKLSFSYSFGKHRSIACLMALHTTLVATLNKAFSALI